MKSFFSSTKIGLAVAATLTLSACGFIPDDGPGARVISHAVNRGAVPQFATVTLTMASVQALKDVPPPPEPTLTMASSNAAYDIIREGDTLAVTVFEPTGAALFQMTGTPGSMTPVSTSEQSFPPLLVGADGRINLPYAGSVKVAGQTTDQAALLLKAALTAHIPSPQVVVGLVSTKANTVSVLGEVRNVGRFPLGANSDTLLDAIAAAGGPTKPYQDIDVQIVRGDQTATIPMSEIMKRPDENIRLAPRDQIRLLPDERKFDVFGALNKVTQIPIVDDKITLADALSRGGGLDTLSANNSTVYLFRFERPAVIKALGLNGPETARGIPTLYRLDMRRDATAFLVADSFQVENGDMIYVPRADLVTLNKFMQAVNAIAQANYSAHVSGVP
jgi:polysaccharide export outer membrane protein